MLMSLTQVFAQQLVLTASQTNATTNDQITFQLSFLPDNGNCSITGNLNWQFGEGAVIIGGAGTTNVTVRYPSPGQRVVSVIANGIYCDGIASGAGTRRSMTVNITQAPIPPVTISGFVLNNCGTGVAGVTITFTGIGNFGGTNFSATTSFSGFYSVTVPYTYSSTISASKPNHQFSASQNYTNTTANRTLNFSVVGQGHIIAISDCINGEYSIGGLVSGFEYIITYENANSQGSIEFEAHSEVQKFDFNRTCYQKNLCAT